jgi:hypothetical protein
MIRIHRALSFSHLCMVASALLLPMMLSGCGSDSAPSPAKGDPVASPVANSTTNDSGKVGAKAKSKAQAKAPVESRQNLYKKKAQEGPG